MTIPDTGGWGIYFLANRSMGWEGRGTVLGQGKTYVADVMDVTSTMIL
jgi:hypothetical protein